MLKEKSKTSKIEGIEIEEFVAKIIKKIPETLFENKGELVGNIKFEISIEKAIKAKGGLKVYILDGGIESQKKSIAKISFEVNPYFSSIEAFGKSIKRIL